MISKKTTGKRAPNEGALRTITLVVGLMMVMTIMTSMSITVIAEEAPMADLTDPSMEIDGNAALAAVATGNGTYADPYVIEGLGINATGYKNALKISNTDAYLIVKDCEFAYANVGNQQMEKFGLMLEGCYNVTVINVTSYGNENGGIGIDTSYDVRILDCNLSNNGIDGLSISPEGGGVRLHISSDVIVDNCTMMDNYYSGVVIETNYYDIAIDNVTISNCSISGTRFGIWSQSNYDITVNDLTIENCTITDYRDGGLWLVGGTNKIRQSGWLIKDNVIDNDDVISTFGAMHLEYLTGAVIANNEISHTYASHYNEIIRLYISDNITVAECNVHDNAQIGLQTSYCENVTFRDSVISNNNNHGIFIDDSFDIDIINVSIDANDASGIRTQDSSRIVIEGCEITGNEDHGVLAYVGTDDLDISKCTISNTEFGYGVKITSQAENVTVVNNTFTGNHGATGIYDALHVQAYDYGANNTWNDSEGGNRWSDWLGPDADYDGFVDAPYDIDGIAGAQDMLPLADSESIPPEVVITAPGNGAVLASTDVTVEWGAWDNQTGLDRIEVTVDSDAPVDVGLNTSMDISLSEGAHTVIVTAYDAMDNDGSDSVSFSITLPTVPGTPTGLTTTPSDTSVLLGWAAPSNGGSTITSYNVYRGTDPGSLSEVGTSNGTSYSDDGLVNGITYHYAVSAENSVGEGPQSDVVNATPVNVPGTPMNLTASVNGTSIELSWDESEDNGSDILHYNIYRGTTVTLTKIGESTVSSFIDTGLVGGTTYRYQVSAVNSVGEGVRSQEVQGTVITVPDAPTNLELSLTDEGVHVEWDPPTSDGGSAVAYYLVYRGLSSNNLTMMNNGSSLSYDDVDPVPGSTYYYALTAVNSIGEGARSAVENITFIISPGAPQDLQAEVMASGIMLTWSAPTNDGGATVTGYCIYYGAAPGLLDSNLTVNSTQHLFTDLEAGTTYSFRVTAISEMGQGESTEIVNATFVTAPFAPVNSDAEESVDGIMLTWSAPTNDGGLEITSYNVYRSIGGGSMVLLVTINETEYLDTDVQDNTTYDYVIRAVNSAGEGAGTSQFSILYHPFVPEDDDGGLQWYIFLIPIVLVLVLLFLVLWARKRKDKGEGEEEA